MRADVRMKGDRETERRNELVDVRERPRDLSPVGIAPPGLGMAIDLSDDLVFHNYVRESVYNPGAKIVKGYSNAMSNFTGLVSLKQLEELMAFMKTLSPKYVAPSAPDVPKPDKPPGSEASNENLRGPVTNPPDKK